MRLVPVLVKKHLPIVFPVFFMESFLYTIKDRSERNVLKRRVLKQLRWVLSGINRQLFLDCLDPNIFYFFKGTSSCKVDKNQLSSAFNDCIKKVCRIKVAPDANSVYWYPHFWSQLHTGS